MAGQRSFFISHSVKDAEIARWIVAALEKGGFKCWIAPRDIPEGAPYDAAIVDGLMAASDVVILVSSASNASEHVAREIALAQDNNKRVLPIRVEEVEPQGSLAYRLTRLQRIDYFANPDQALQELSDAAGAPLPKPDTRAPRVAPDMDDGKRPLTRLGGVYASLVLGMVAGVLWAVADFESPTPSTPNIGQAVGMGLIAGALVLGPLFMLSRWLVASGDRRNGVQPRRYLDTPFIGVLAAAGALGVIGLLTAEGSAASDTGNVGALFAAISTFAFTTPVFALIYYAARHAMAGQKTPVQRPLNVAPSRFERFALFGVIPIFILGVIPFAESPDEKAAPAEPPAQAVNYSLTDREIASSDHGRLVSLAVERVGVDAVRSGAEGGDALGQSLMCAAYDRGVGVTADAEFARTWCRRAADQGQSIARFILAMYKINGVSEAADVSAGLAELEAVAEAGDARAQYALGTAYLNGDFGLAVDDAQALAMLRRAAEQGQPDAQFNLAWMYENGRGAPKDYATALLWYQKLADEGDRTGIRAVGWMNYNGWGTPKDLPRAAELYKQASDLGDANASANLASMYETGEGVAKDLDEAVRLYRLADSQGSTTAKDDLTRLGVAGD